MNRTPASTPGFRTPANNTGPSAFQTPGNNNNNTFNWDSPFAGQTNDDDLAYEAYLRRQELDKQARIEELAQKAQRDLQEKRRRQQEEEDRAKLEKDEEILRQYKERQRQREEEGETDEEFETDAARLNKIMERRRFVQQRRERKKRGEDLASTTTEESLTMPFTRVSKVLASLNNPTVVTNEDIRQRNIEHLNKLDQTNIRTSFRKSLQPGETAIEERFTRLLAEYIGESENRIMNVIEENLANRVARIEENERLSSRVLTKQVHYS
jgi:hypothetical protein